MGEKESDRNEIDQNEVDDSEDWKQFNEMNANGTSSESSASSNSSYDSSDYDSNRPYYDANSSSYWSTENSLSSISSSSFSSDSISSTTSSCSSCSESYQDSLNDGKNYHKRKGRRNNFEPHEPVEPVGIWRYQNGQLVTLEENADMVDGYFMNLTQAEEEMMRMRMCDVDGGFWCNQTVDYSTQSNFGFPGLGGGKKKKNKKKKPVPPKAPEVAEKTKLDGQKLLSQPASVPAKPSVK